MNKRKNITISVDESTARLVRIEAAKQGTSTSRYISNLLNSVIQTDASYEKAMESFLKRKPYIDSKGKSYPKRDDLYE